MDLERITNNQSFAAIVGAIAGGLIGIVVTSLTLAVKNYPFFVLFLVFIVVFIIIFAIIFSIFIFILNKQQGEREQKIKPILEGLIDKTQKVLSVPQNIKNIGERTRYVDSVWHKAKVWFEKYKDKLNKDSIEYIKQLSIKLEPNEYETLLRENGERLRWISLNLKHGQPLEPDDRVNTALQPNIANQECYEKTFSFFAQKVSEATDKELHPDAAKVILVLLSNAKPTYVVKD